MSFELDKASKKQSCHLILMPLLLRLLRSSWTWPKKTDLLDIAAHYEFTSVKSSMLKHEIKNILIQFFVNEEIFDSSTLSHILVTQTDLQMRELEIKRQIEIEKLRLEERIRIEKSEREERIRIETIEREDRLQRERLEQEKTRLEHEKLRIEMEELEKEREKIERMLREKLEMEERIEIEKENLKLWALWAGPWGLQAEI